MTERFEVAVVGGGPAGALVAARLAGLGRDVVLLERLPSWRWRACGVFSSPVTMRVLARAGVDGRVLAAAARPIPAMRVETPRGAVFRLSYGDDGSLAAPAVGFDRARLDPALLDLARERGALVRTGTTVRAVHLAGGRRGMARLEVLGPDDRGVIEAGLVVGADGARSVVGRAAGVARAAPLGSRVGLTFHVPDPMPGPHDARMVVIDDAYVGLAPVPGGRLNVGIVLSGKRREALRRDGAERVAQMALERADVPFAPCDAIAGAAPLGHRTRRRAGRTWLLAGDAAGFLDPFTGEGLHRAAVSAELAAHAVDGHLRGEPGALGGYERAMRARFVGKDALSLLIQLFLARPALFEHAARRLAARHGVRETMGLVIGDLAPASRALDPRYLAALLRP